jgi:antitoxin VapB
MLYILLYIYTIPFLIIMSAKTAKIFPNGGSQAVRLPAEFRFEGVDEVYIRHDAVTGEVILSAKPVSGAWADFFALRDQARVPDDFMVDLPLSDTAPPLDPREEP